MQSTELFINLFNSIFFHGDTPLHVAAYYNKLDICEVLIKKGAAINATNRQIRFQFLKIHHYIMQLLSQI